MDTAASLPWVLALLLVLGVGTFAARGLHEHLVRAGVDTDALLVSSGEPVRPPRERHRTERARRPVQRSTRPPSYDW